MLIAVLKLQNTIAIKTLHNVIIVQVQADITLGDVCVRNEARIVSTLLLWRKIHQVLHQPLDHRSSRQHFPVEAICPHQQVRDRLALIIWRYRADSDMVRLLRLRGLMGQGRLLYVDDSTLNSTRIVSWLPILPNTLHYMYTGDIPDMSAR